MTLLLKVNTGPTKQLFFLLSSQQYDKFKKLKTFEIETLSFIIEFSIYLMCL